MMKLDNAPRVGIRSLRKPAFWIGFAGACALIGCNEAAMRAVAPEAETSAAAAVSSAPVITVQPENTSALPGEPFQFSITASGGAGSLRYQWIKRSKDGTSISTIPGANAATYSKIAVLGDETFIYSCVVSDGTQNGNVTSSNALLGIGRLGFEAEEGILSNGAEVKNTWKEFSGTGYVALPPATGASVTWTVYRSFATPGYLNFRYATAAADEKLRVYVNGRLADAGIPIPGNVPTTWKLGRGTVNLNQGKNVITVTATGAGGMYLDYFDIH